MKNSGHYMKIVKNGNVYNELFCPKMNANNSGNSKESGQKVYKNNIKYFSFCLFTSVFWYF